MEEDVDEDDVTYPKPGNSSAQMIFSTSRVGELTT